PRNLTDDMLRALARNGGVVMLNFADVFLDPRRVEFGKRLHAVEVEMRRQFPDDPARVKAECQKYLAANQPGRTPLSALIDHLDHAVRTAGVDHVGLGLDFDGEITPPSGLDDVSQFPNITIELVRRGYRDADIKKILGENLLRVMAAAEKTALVLRAEQGR